MFRSLEREGRVSEFQKAQWWSLEDKFKLPDKFRNSERATSEVQRPQEAAKSDSPFNPWVEMQNSSMV
jgi:hypothetical protein